jgi:carboxypeptidase C (cathepsin A)
VATGFSRAAKDEKPDEFFGDSADLDSVGEFIRLWTTRHDRWLSPKYLCGESYGVFRAAGLADHLSSRYGMYLNGLILVSGVLDFATIYDNPGNDVPYPLYLPAYTAAAQFHKKLPPICKTICRRRWPRRANLRRANTPRPCSRAIRSPPTSIKKSPPNSSGSPA